MKKILQLLLLVMHGAVAMAQISNGKNTGIAAFIKTAKDTLSPAGYWLVQVKEHASIPTPSSWQVVRQLSASEIIIHTANKQKPVHASFITVLPASNNWKLSPYLLDKLQSNQLQENNTYTFQLQAIQPSLLKTIPDQHTGHIALVYEYGNTSVIRITLRQLLEVILPNETVTFVTLADKPPKEEVNINGFDNSANAVNKLHSNYPLLNGSGIVVSVKENKPDSADIDFKGRFLATNNSSNTISDHATIMSTIIAGAGNSFYTGKGVAWGGTISSSGFAILLPDNDAGYRQYNISVQNHSYGTGIENFYGADAAAYDASMNNNLSLLHIFSSGNSGSLAGNAGQYNGIGGWANLTGSFKMSKNSISVGSVDSFGTVPSASSKGPAYDGRIKPELTAFGEDGSSGAAALVTGTAMVLQQSYAAQHGNVLPDAALVKAVLLNSATDVGSKGIDFSAGFGSLNAYRAVQVMQGNQFFNGMVAQSAAQTFSITLPANAKNLKVLLAWTDQPATANAFTALVNDLDMTLTHIASSQTWQPWVLNSSPNKDSLLLAPVRKRDSLNNVEQITIDDPLPGNYTIAVNGQRITTGLQKFFITWQWDTANTFSWSYPTKNDNLLPGKQNALRWENNYAANGLLEYKWAGANNWLPVATAVNLQGGYYKWIAPDSSAVMQLRMTVSGQSYTSDTFTVSPRLIPGVGFNCPDSFLLYWNRNIANNYSLYRLGSQYLQPLQTLTDTSIVLNKTASNANWYAVAPLLPYNKTGLKSIAFDYTRQGVACYLKNFTADFVSNTALLHIELGATYQVKRVSVEKRTAAGYQLLQTFTSPALQYSGTDDKLVHGLNTYRVKIELANGSIIYSNEETVYYFASDKYIVYPNPVNRLQGIHIIATELNNPVFTLFNATGQKVFEKTLLNLSEEIAMAPFAKGVYFYVLFKNGQRDAQGKIIVQ